jgi:Protein of unknown function (DUF2478)
MARTASMIGVVRGKPGAAAQALFETLVARRREERIAGVIAESHGLNNRTCNAGFLRSIATGERFPIFQDLARSPVTWIPGE